MEETSDVSPRYYTYVLYSLSKHNFYIGFTKDLKNRLSLHSKGQVISTKTRRPLKLIHYEYFISRQDAEAREKFLKSGYGRKQLREILKHTFEGLL